MKGPLGILGITFVVMKLVGVIGWSWWLVTLPFWAIPAALWGGCLMIMLAACVGILIGDK